MTDGILDGELPAQAAGDEVKGGQLHEVVQIELQLIGQERHTDRIAVLDAFVQHGAVVNKQLRNLHVEMLLPMNTVAEPALGLLGEPVDENQGREATIISWGATQPAT